MLDNSPANFGIKLGTTMSDDDFDVLIAANTANLIAWGALVKSLTQQRIISLNTLKSELTRIRDKAITDGKTDIAEGLEAHLDFVEMGLSHKTIS